MGLAIQGFNVTSSFVIEYWPVRLIIQVDALRDIKMADREGSSVGYKRSYRSGFCQQNSSWTRRNLSFTVSRL